MRPEDPVARSNFEHFLAEQERLHQDDKRPATTPAALPPRVSSREPAEDATAASPTFKGTSFISH
jgi:hypothetical protein